MKKKTSAEIDALIANWANDPCWTLEDTEGFEENRAALKAALEAAEREHELKLQLIDKAQKIGMPGNAVFAQYVIGLEEKIRNLEYRAEEMLNRMAAVESKVKHA